MRKFIIATHRSLARGLADSLEFFTKKGIDVYQINAYMGDNNFPEDKVQEIMNSFTDDDEVVILTDIVSGSVTQKMYPYINERTFLISGVNMPLALSLLLYPSNTFLSVNKIHKLIKQAREQIVLVNDLNSANQNDDE
ncbi:PTS sugar transporter subunit IIA [Liquorilactobacillus mali]|uniref:PTS sugar transporter subunit IIA n=1 Tax=Liquorilactobacillus mali TaxID=1618 RepID=UPI0029530867|nr:PTS N-acetylglucosamine transporter subunit IIBC [Liquorilactobacillus mali]MDV7757535.1 hypothetical protein [Liquorilactobacillus mali]